MFTWQDFIAIKDKDQALHRAISENNSSSIVRTARNADLYDRQKNVTISNFVKMLYTRSGSVPDTYGSNHRICSNFFRHLNTQRMSYSLGNGITFASDPDLKGRMGIDFDSVMRNAGYYSLKHGVTFVFWNVDHCHVFPITEFAPLWDEETGELMAGVRYWQIDSQKPMQAILYEVDGYTRFRAKSSGEFVTVEEKRSYRMDIVKAPADSEPEIVGESNYGSLPIVPMYGSRLKQSTLVGMQGAIDAFDLIRSGFANDLSDCGEIYWIVNNAGGMDDADLARFRDRLKHNHIANVADAEETSVTPYTQDIPYAARQAFLADIRSGIYEDFGGLDVHSVQAGTTNDHLEAAYQPLDDNADEFEYQVIDCIQHILRLIGVEDTPLFKRNRISNESERTNMILSASSYLDDMTVLNLLPFITPDMVREIMERKELEDYERMNTSEDTGSENSEGNETEEEQ